MVIKEKLFQWLFPQKFNQIKELETLIEERLKPLEEQAQKEPSMNELMRESIGLPYIDFSNVDEEGMPPHYLSGLSDEGRKAYVADLESIYSNEKFQEVCSYIINVVGNHAIQKASEDKMRNGRIGIIGIRTLLTEFSNAHSEYLSSRSKPEEFDPLGAMPE